MSGLSGAAKLIHHVLQLLADEHGNNRGRCLVGPQSMVISHVCRGFAKQIGVAVNRL